MGRKVRAFDLMVIALHFVLQFGNISESNIYLMQWPASDYSLVLGLSPHNRLSQRNFV